MTISIKYRIFAVWLLVPVSVQVSLHQNCIFAYSAYDLLTTIVVSRS